MPLPLYWIDAFADRPFAGNPAAVIPLADWLADPVMQRIAFENGLAETAFFVRTGAARFHLRWFTPAVEVDLCGHATLATAHALFHELGQPGQDITFDTRSGPLTVTRREDGKLTLDFPATPVAPEPSDEVARIVTGALGQAPLFIGRTVFDLFAELPDAASVRALVPDFAAIARAGSRGLIVTAPGDGTCDFVSRFFAPQSGINEDPATGSTHCALAPFWAGRLGKRLLHARQLSARGGELWCEPTGDRVRLTGQSVLYLRGELFL
jgi:PhzF family phenazine biosynthesis protein